MKLAKLKLLILILLTLGFGLAMGFSNEVKNENYSANVFPGNGVVKINFSRTGSKQSKTLSVKGYFASITNKMLAGKYLFFLGPDSLNPSSSPDYFSDCSLVDLDKGELVNEHDLYAMIKPAVSPDDKKIIYDEFRPLHFRRDDDTSDIRVLISKQDGFVISSIYPEIKQRFPSTADQTDDEEKVQDIVDLSSEFLWDSNSQRAVFFVSKENDKENFLRIVLLDLSGSSIQVREKGLPLDSIKNYFKPGVSDKPSDVASTFSIKPDSLKWIGSSKIEFKLIPHGTFIETPIQLDVP